MRSFLESTRNIKLRFVADTPIKRCKGLMFQEPLQPNEGALFVFNYPTKSGFWNKNVSFPIQIGFFDKNRKLIGVEKLEAYQEKSIGPTSEYLYALEVPNGFFNDIRFGTSLDNLISQNKKCVDN